MRSAGLALVLCLLGGAGQAGERAASLVNSFAVMCALEPLDFARSDEKAAAMKLPVRKDLRTPPDASGHFIHSKSWLLPLKSGPHEFVVAEARGPKGDVKSCGIGAPDVDGNDFKAELTKALKLGRPADEGTLPGGERRTAWRYGPERLDLMLVDGSPKSQPGIYLTLTKNPPAR
ncbi:MAG TPA: hypothetical protein VF601_20630 [Beijerinckiaceae bacterium]|jgi:hypothetical protein